MFNNPDTLTYLSNFSQAPSSLQSFYGQFLSQRQNSRRTEEDPDFTLSPKKKVKLNEAEQNQNTFGQKITSNQAINHASTEQNFDTRKTSSQNELNSNSQQPFSLLSTGENNLYPNNMFSAQIRELDCPNMPVNYQAGQFPMNNQLGLGFQAWEGFQPVNSANNCLLNKNHCDNTLFQNVNFPLFSLSKLQESQQHKFEAYLQYQQVKFDKFLQKMKSIFELCTNLPEEMPSSPEEEDEEEESDLTYSEISRKSKPNNKKKASISKTKKRNVTKKASKSGSANKKTSANNADELLE